MLTESVLACRYTYKADCSHRQPPAPLLFFFVSRSIYFIFLILFKIYFIRFPFLFFSPFPHLFTPYSCSLSFLCNSSSSWGWVPSKPGAAGRKQKHCRYIFSETPSVSAAFHWFLLASKIAAGFWSPQSVLRCTCQSWLANTVNHTAWCHSAGPCSVNYVIPLHVTKPPHNQILYFVLESQH